jgi:hypothetical protein
MTMQYPNSAISEPADNAKKVARANPRADKVGLCRLPLNRQLTHCSQAVVVNNVAALPGSPSGGLVQTPY